MSAANNYEQNYKTKTIYLDKRAVPQYIAQVVTIQPICVCKWNPPENVRYGNMIRNAINESLKTPSTYAIPNMMKIFGISPIMICKP